MLPLGGIGWLVPITSPQWLNRDRTRISLGRPPHFLAWGTGQTPINPISLASGITDGASQCLNMGHRRIVKGLLKSLLINTTENMGEDGQNKLGGMSVKLEKLPYNARRMGHSLGRQQQQLTCPQYDHESTQSSPNCKCAQF